MSFPPLNHRDETPEWPFAWRGNLVTDLLDHALRYAALGWRIMPLRGKAAFIGKGFLDATNDIATIREWWTRYPDANIGWVPGDEHWVMDVDPRHGGDDTLERLVLSNGPLPDTMQQETGGGGRHHVFIRRPVQLIQCSQNRIGMGLDVKTGNGYIVVAPSIHPDTGKPYIWDGAAEFDQQTILEAPKWLLALAMGTHTPKDAPESIGGTFPAGEKIAAGGRHNHLVSLAGTLRKRGVSRQVIEAALLAESVSRYEPGKVLTQAEGWPEIIPLESKTIDPLPVACVPGWLGEMAQALAQSTETPFEMSALLAIAVASSCIAAKADVSPEAGYTEPLNLYVCPAMER